MKSIITALVICIVPIVSKCEDAPRKADFGREVLDPGERLFTSFTVHAKVLVLKGNNDKPIILKMPLPLFPSKAFKIGLVGESVVSFTIMEDGRVDGVHSVRSTHKMFEQESLAAVSQWSFAPPESLGKPTQLVVQVTFIFSMYDIEE